MNDEVPGSSSNIDGPDLETLDYLRGVKSSTCLLLPTTPSPHPLDFKHPLSEEMKENQFEILNDGTNMINLQSLDPAAGDSSSSGDSNSVIQDPVSAQLINKISMLDYQTLSKNGDIIMGQEEDCKLNGNISANNRKLPSFVNWNWVIIRKFLFWIVLSGLIACLGTIIAMVITIPKTCNPDLPWYQGKVFYEVFPASFEDSNNDGIGDLKGLIKKIDYINDLGASAIRLNYIYKSKKYPEDYKSITSLLNIHESLGFAKDFQNLVTAVHNKNMSLVLDIPVWSMVTPKHSSNASHIISFVNDTIVTEIDPTTAALLYWAKNQSVDGFYLKDLENFVDDLNFARTLQVWKQIVGMDKIFIASEEAFEKSTGANRNVLLNRIDLIDVHLDLHDGIDGLKNRIDKIITGPLWEKPHYPWVHWNIGDIKSERISTKHFNNTLALIALEFSLPGTVSIFYGDEIGLTDLQPQEVEQDFLEHHQLHNLVPMAFSNNNNKRILPWNSGSDLKPQYHFLEYIKMLTGVRLSTPTLYLRSIYKEGHIMKNTEVRKTQKNLVVIERWHPRRNTCVFVGNLGDKAITTDLSAMYYGGLVVAGTNASLVGQVIYFDEVTFLANSAIILKLEK